MQSERSTAPAGARPAPAEPPAVLNAAGVARLLGRSSAAGFLSARRRLEAAGFPRRLPGINGWSRAAVLRWVETNGETHRPAERPSGPTLEDAYGEARS